MEDKILVFIPTYNCENEISFTLDQLLSDEIKNFISEVLVVDNRSQDNTLKTVQNYIKNSENFLPITILENKENYGLGGSHKVAIKYAKQNEFDYLITLHGDNQGKIIDILPYLKNETYKDYDCLLGSRFMKQSKLINYAKFRIFGNRVFNIIYSVVSRKKLKDLGSGLNMYKVSIFNDDWWIKTKDNLTFNYEMILCSCYLKHRILFFPITWEEAGQRSNVKMVKQSFTTLKIALSYLFGKKRFVTKDKRLNKNYKYESQIIIKK